MLIGIVQTFAVALDYSLLDLFRALGVAVSPGAVAFARGLLDQDRAGRADPPVPAAGADADRAAARAPGHARDLSGRTRVERARCAASAASTSRAWRVAIAPWLVAVAVVLVLPHVPGLASNSARSLLCQMGIAAIFALSYNMLLGQTGLLSFGHAVYFGARRLRGDSPHARDQRRPAACRCRWCRWSAPRAGLAFGIVFGAVTTRRAGSIFALISLGVGELVHAAARMLPGFFGGEEGITANRTLGAASVRPDFGSQLQVYYVIAVWPLRLRRC